METEGGNPPYPNPNTKFTPVVGATGLFWDGRGGYSYPAHVVSGLYYSLHQRPTGDWGRVVRVLSAYGDLEVEDAENEFEAACDENAVGFCGFSLGYRHRAYDIIAFDILDFVVQNLPPATIVFISGNAEFVPLLSKLGGKGYNIMAIGISDDASSAFRKAGFALYDLGPASRGEGLFPLEEAAAGDAVRPLLSLKKLVPTPLAFLAKPRIAGLLLLSSMAISLALSKYSTPNSFNSSLERI